MSLYKLFLLAGIVFALAGCRTLYCTESEFLKTARKYDELIRWGESQKACLAYVDPARKDDCLKRGAKADSIKVVDYRVKLTDCNKEKGEATARVEFDYLSMPSTKLKTVEDVQNWQYLEKEMIWQLTTLPPEFP